MSDLIDRQAILKHIEKIRQSVQMMDDTHRASIIMIGMYLGEKAVRNQPSVQSEIIRCKDCENWDTTWQNDWAKNYHYCPLIDGTRNGDWYCADAERRTDE